MHPPTDFPPLTPLDEMPLHSGRSDWDEGWFGCEYPERPSDLETLWDWRCRPCVLHATTTLLTQGDAETTWYKYPGAEPTMVTLKWNIDRANYWSEHASSDT